MPEGERSTHDELEASYQEHSGNGEPAPVKQSHQRLSAIKSSVGGAISGAGSSVAGRVRESRGYARENRQAEHQAYTNPEVQKARLLAELRVEEAKRLSSIPKQPAARAQTHPALRPGAMERGFNRRPSAPRRTAPSSGRNPVPVSRPSPQPAVQRPLPASRPASVNLRGISGHIVGSGRPSLATMNPISPAPARQSRSMDLSYGFAPRRPAPVVATPPIKVRKLKLTKVQLEELRRNPPVVQPASRRQKYW